MSLLNAFDPFAAMAELTGVSRKVATTIRRLAETDADDVQIATTPREEIHRIGSRVLYRLAVDRPRRVAVPVLVVYALVGRWTVLDLQEDRSFLRNLAAAGCDVYVLDWGHPTAADRFDGFADLVELYLDTFIEVILERHAIPALSLLGVCQGGVLSLCYAALHPDRVRNLVTAVTPVDFHADREDARADRGLMNVWARGLTADDVDAMIDTFGNVHGDVGGAAFSLMTPLRSLAKYNLTLLEIGQDRAKLLNFLRMESWLADRPAHPGEAARQWLKELYQENRLAHGTFVLDGRRVDLGAITMPVLNIYTETDHIIPSPMSKALRRHVGTPDYSELAVPGGHIGVFVGGKAQAQLRAGIVGWLEAR